MSILVESAIKFDNVDLNKLMAIHLNFIGTQCVKNFQLNNLQTPIRRSKRPSTNNWNNSYNLIAIRTSYEQNYQYSLAYLWVGVSKSYAKVANGDLFHLGIKYLKAYLFKFMLGPTHIHLLISSILVVKISHQPMLLNMDVYDI